MTKISLEHTDCSYYSCMALIAKCYFRFISTHLQIDYPSIELDILALRIRSGSCFLTQKVISKSSCCPFRNAKCFLFESWISRTVRSLNCASCCILHALLHKFGIILPHHSRNCTFLLSFTVSQKNLIPMTLILLEARNCKREYRTSCATFSIHGRFIGSMLLYCL